MSTKQNSAPRERALIREAIRLYRTALDESRKLALAAGAHALVKQIDDALAFGDPLRRGPPR